jgi:DNA-binding transcriptional MerR regulator
MSHYSIKDLEQITGVKAHTIRIWEKRYGIVNPMRTESNIRFYCDEDLKKLLNISILLKHGYKISKLAGIDKVELGERIREISMVQNGHECDIENLVVSMIELDEKKFNSTLSQLIIKEGFENTVFNVIYPFFDKIGTLWQTGTINPAQEHFISNLVKQKIYVAIDGIQREFRKDAKTFVLFLPEWEMHELGMLMYNYIIKSRGHKVVYLGQSVPYEDIKRVSEIHKPDFIFSSFAFAVDENKLEKYLKTLASDFEDSQIIVTGYQTANLPFKLPANLHQVSSATQFKEEYLKEE